MPMPWQILKPGSAWLAPAPLLMCGARCEELSGAGGRL
jgi:hypothetical protein